MEMGILLSMRSPTDNPLVLHDPAQIHDGDIDVVSAKVKQEFAAKGRAFKKAMPKAQGKTTKKAA
jgi:ParB family chromosome partitioning protein